MNRNIPLYCLLALILSSCVFPILTSDTSQAFIGTVLLNRALQIPISAENVRSYYNEEDSHVIVYAKIELSPTDFMEFYQANCKPIGPLFWNDFLGLSSYIRLPSWWDVTSDNFYGGTKCQANDVSYDMGVRGQHNPSAYILYLRLYIN